MSLPTPYYQDEAVTRPLVRWHGGKFRLAPWILSFFPPHRIYVEPFGGGASVLLRKPRAHAEIYNDLDGEVVNLFRVVRDHGDELRRRIALTPFGRQELLQAKVFSGDFIERARQLLIRSHMGFGSNAASAKECHVGFRNNARRRGSVPALDWARLPDGMGPIVNRFRGVVIESMPAADLICKLDAPEVLFYVDPPYLMETRKDGRADYRHEMTRADHVELAKLLHACKGRVVLSGYASPLYEDLYSGWARHEAPALADGGTPRTEVLWMNFQPAQEVMAL